MLLIQAMQPGQQRDELVALTAVNTLHVLIDDWYDDIPIGWWGWLSNTTVWSIVFLCV